MAIKTFQVTTYEVGLGFKNTATWEGVQILIQGHLVCHSADGFRFIVYGLHPASKVPNPVYIEANKVGAIFIPFGELHNYIELVRNEKPIYVYLNSANPGWNSIRTSKEPVGEQEGV
ncbi:hypothetical protein [Mariniphaga sp.]|uniref:hypothetical protein n=1 Tax=Mariniphaga sp. TaxID=1954475 RepID=UPI0035633D62